MVNGEYYCPSCDEFHLLNEFVDKGWGFSCPVTKEEIKWWKSDDFADCWQVARLLGYENVEIPTSENQY